MADAEASEKGVYSNVPYTRVEYVAREIKAYFNLDVALIRGYGLPEDAIKLLIALSLLKVRRFLSAHLRLRTACDFQLAGDVRATAPAGFVLPDEATLLVDVKTGIAACETLFANPAVTELITPVKVKKGDQAIGAAATI